MATDHSDIQNFPTSRWVQLQSTGTNMQVITLPTTVTGLRISILEGLESDKTTAAAFQVRFGTSLTDDTAMPAIAAGAERIQIAAGSQLRDVTVPMLGSVAATQMAVSGANSGWVNVAYDVVPGGRGGI